MRSIEIDLAAPFEKVLAAALSLPAGCSDVVSDRLTSEAQLKQVLRGLYEAANGRHVETNVGFVRIAPPVFDSLKTKPFRVDTQTDLLIEAAARLINGSVSVDRRTEVTETISDEPTYETSIQYRPIHRARTPLVANANTPL